ncbi:MAG TPA: sulfite exporter TauE/SafE family protein [Stenomitos sp.]
MNLGQAPRPAPVVTILRKKALLADPLLFMPLLFAVSILAGTFGALLGIGGGMIVVPFLTSVLHVDMHLAIGASIVSVIATSSGSAAAYLKDRLTNVRVGMLLEIGTTTGGILGALLAAFAPTTLLSLLFGLVLAFSAYQMLGKIHLEHEALETSSPLAEKLKLGGTYYDTHAQREVRYGVTGVLPGMGIMVLAGALSGMLGIGGGAFKVLAMDLMMRLPMKVSTTTSNLMIGATAAASAGIYFFRGEINPYLAGPVALGVLVGSRLGTRLLIRMRNERLRQLFVVLLAALAAQMLWKGLSALLGGWPHA